MTVSVVLLEDQITILSSPDRPNYYVARVKYRPINATFENAGLTWEEALGAAAQFLLGRESSPASVRVSSGMDRADWDTLVQILAAAGWDIQIGLFLVDDEYHLFRLASGNGDVVEYLDTFTDVEARVISLFC